MDLTANFNETSSQPVPPIEMNTLKLPNIDPHTFSKTFNMEGLKGNSFWIQLLKEAVNKFEALESWEQMSERHLVALDMLKFSAGFRPTFLIENGKLDTAQPNADRFSDFLNQHRCLFSTTARSVGRITITGLDVGTGFVVGHGLIMTTREILDEIAYETGDTWQFKFGAEIHFDQTDIRAKAFSFGYTVPWENDKTAKVYCDPTTTDAPVIIRLEQSQRLELPAPLVLNNGILPITLNDPVMLFHYTGKLLRGYQSYGDLYHSFDLNPGAKRMAIGEINQRRQQNFFGHDCITLGSARGAPIVQIHDGTAFVVGIHIADRSKGVKIAHSMEPAFSSFPNIGLNGI